MGSDICVRLKFSPGFRGYGRELLRAGLPVMVFIQI